MSNGIFGGNEALGDTIPTKIERFLPPVKAPAPTKIGKFLDPVATPKPLDLSSLKNMFQRKTMLTRLADGTVAPVVAEEAGGINTNLLTYVAIGGVALVGAYLLFGRKR